MDSNLEFLAVAARERGISRADARFAGAAKPQVPFGGCVLNSMRHSHKPRIELEHSHPAARLTGRPSIALMSKSCPPCHVEFRHRLVVRFGVPIALWSEQADCPRTKFYWVSGHFGAGPRSAYADGGVVVAAIGRRTAQSCARGCGYGRLYCGIPTFRHRGRRASFAGRGAAR